MPAASTNVAASPLANYGMDVALHHQASVYEDRPVRQVNESCAVYVIPLHRPGRASGASYFVEKGVRLREPQGDL